MRPPRTLIADRGGGADDPLAPTAPSAGTRGGKGSGELRLAVQGVVQRAEAGRDGVRETGASACDGRGGGCGSKLAGHTMLVLYFSIQRLVMLLSTTMVGWNEMSGMSPACCSELLASDCIYFLKSSERTIAPPKPPCSASSFAKLGRTSCKSAACAVLYRRRFALPGRSFDIRAAELNVETGGLVVVSSLL